MTSTAKFPALIISGGQTGADRAALDFAIAHRIAHAGYCPKGRKSEDGPIPFCYNLDETETAEYPERTRKNIELADATVIFHKSPESSLVKQRTGSALTLRLAQKLKKPVLVLHHKTDPNADASALVSFLRTHQPKVLNVAGSRETSQPGIAAHVAAVLEIAASQMPSGNSPH